MKKRNAKRFLSTAIAMTMAAEMLPVQSLISSASGYDDLVTSLARLYDGDEKMARDLLDDLRNAGMTARNGQVGKDTTFKVKLYKAITKGRTLVKTGDPIWTGDFISTLDEPLTHITVPGEELTEAGNYCVEISTEYYGGEVREKQTVAMSGLSATAFITAK